MSAFSPPAGDGVTPLRIAKRGSPQPQPSETRLERIQLARRTSSSYKAVRNNNLVSNSPFKSQIPLPTLSRPSNLASSSSTPTRRVSGEKRPRPLSMTEPAEEDAPDKKRASQGIERLAEREQVSKSPFKQRSASAEPDASPPPLAPPTLSVDTTTAAGSQSGASPRSALVSRRLHGPRSSDGQGSVSGKRQRRKTVTFNECCDVVEFDQLSIELRDDDPFYSEGSGGDEEDEDDEYGDGPQVDLNNFDLSREYDPAEHTPMATSPLPLDMEDEDGTASGRPQYHDRGFSHPDEARKSLSREGTPQMDAITFKEYGEHVDGHSISDDYDEHEHINIEVEQPHPDEYIPHTTSTPPLPIDRATRSPLPDVKDEPDLDPIELSFISSSSLDPANLSVGLTEVSLSGLEEELGIPRRLGDETGTPPRSPRRSFERERRPSIDLAPVAPLRLSTSPGNSPRSPRGALPIPPSPGASASRGSSAPPSPLRTNAAPPGSLGAHNSPAPPSPLGRRGSPAVPSPLARVASPPSYFNGGGSGRMSPFNRGEAGSPFGREEAGDSGRRSPRISRDEVQRRLYRRSMESPLGDAPLISLAGDVKDREGDEVWIKETSSGFPDADANSVDTMESSRDDAHLDNNGKKVTREDTEEMEVAEEKQAVELESSQMRRQDNPTYDGVMSIDPDPQAIDPPRPLLPKRAHTLDEDLRGSLLTDVTPADDGPPVPGGEGLTTSLASMRLSEVSALDRLMEDVGAAEGMGTVVRVEALGEGVVSARFNEGTEEGRMEVNDAVETHRPDVGRAATDSALLAPSSFLSPRPGPPSRNPSTSSTASTLPGKDAIRTRHEMIIEKRREARRRDQGLSMDEGRGYPSSSRAGGYLSPSSAQLGQGLPGGVEARPGRKRSMSTNDATEMMELGLDVDVAEDGDELGESIDRSLRRRGGDLRAKYRVREHEGTIYASADVLGHNTSAGGLEDEEAWRAVRKPSDMNEYAKQIRELRAKDKSGKAYSKLFIKVLGVKNLKVPMPREPTVMTCTLNNGTHWVTTPELPLSANTVIAQEFELIEQDDLEITLILKVRRDRHIASMLQALTPPPPRPAPPPPPPASKGGLRSFFSTPKKTSQAAQRLKPPPPPPEPRIEENLARYLTRDCRLARAMITFNSVAKHCDTKLFESVFPLLGERLEIGMKVTELQIGEVMLQMFRLPALPGVPASKLPQSIQECHDGLRNIHWHKQTYFEGTLTQSGGDCTTWRRRPFRIIGANLVAFNDVTKRATATIDLKKALAVHDDEERTSSTASGDDSLLRMERSFRLVFPKNQEIIFFADTDEEKSKWLEVFRALVGRIPPNPLWAELIWQRQNEQSKQEGSVSRSPPTG
ncbi:hypothetical protein OE88DRAFT_1669083 [Heliocybe sulcata]|uniref:PH domain-containing protein n=1 Tax=Heliocybe sulcata TaxID=5364 RepID=A0A5C3MJV9_9AGAM|nr:hypothetical protein OE88DRAFT_1669083 [Heliocybe sulcata]